MNTSPRAYGTRCRAAVLTLAALTAALSLSCALLGSPTPIALPAPSATPTSTSAPTSTATVPPAATSTSSPTPTPTPTPTLTPTSSPTLTPTPTPTSTATPKAAAFERISFEPNATAFTLVGSLAAGEVRRYGLGIAAGQYVELSATPDQGDALSFSLAGADGTVVRADGEPFYRGTVPSTQDYILTLTNSGGAVSFGLSITIPVRITFASGATSAEVTANLQPFATGEYVIRALGGQTLTVEATTTQGEVILIVYGADGTVLQTDHSGSSTFSGVLPSTQDYLIDVRSVGSVTAAVTLRFTIPPP